MDGAFIFHIILKGEKREQWMLFRVSAIFINSCAFISFISPGNLEGGQGHHSRLKTDLKPQRM